MKLLEKKIQENALVYWDGKDIFGKTQKACIRKVDIEKCDYTWTAEQRKQSRAQPRDREKVFVNCIRQWVSFKNIQELNGQNQPD